MQLKIGIAVVYMVGERNGWLLDLHFRQIRENTGTPYTVYACVNGLLPRFRDRLEREPEVKIVPCEPYRAGSGLLRQDGELVRVKGLSAADAKYEHSWYLEQLIRAAVEDGVTHVAVFHVDSFPIQPGWEETLIGRFTDRRLLAGVTRDAVVDRKPLTAGILFAREFYLRHRPRLLLTQEELDSADYRRFREACPHVTDSGYGYAFRMFMEGLTWESLVKSSRDGGRTAIASIFGDMIFHLHATAFLEKTGSLGFSAAPHRRPGLVGFGVRSARALLPAGVFGRLRGRLKPRVQSRMESGDLESWERERRRLFEDPGRYIARLRS